LRTAEGEAALEKYFDTYAALAERFGTGLILESATWRASPTGRPSWATTRDALTEANRKAIRLLENVRDRFDTPSTPVVISGCLGPRGDGYVPDRAMSAVEAEAYHGKQMEIFADSAADMASAITMNYVEEALGIARAARARECRLRSRSRSRPMASCPPGKRSASAIDQVDDATSAYPCYYMINCAHPTHFAHVVASDAPWVEAHPGAPSERIAHEPRGIERVHRPRRGQSCRARAQYAELRRRLTSSM
jgi:homocysteine S-methyltransferase